MSESLRDRVARVLWEAHTSDGRRADAGDFARDAAFGAFWAVVSKWQGDGHVWHLIRVWHRTQPQVLLKYSAGVLSGEVD